MRFFGLFLNKNRTFILNFKVIVELQLTLPDEHLPTILAMLERFSFVKIEQVDGRKRPKEAFLNDFEASLRQAKQHLDGKIQLKNIATILDEF